MFEKHLVDTAIFQNDYEAVEILDSPRQLGPVYEINGQVNPFLPYVVQEAVLYVRGPT